MNDPYAVLRTTNSNKESCYKGKYEVSVAETQVLSKIHQISTRKMVVSLF